MITLRQLTLNDAKQLVKYLNDADVTRYLSSNIPSPYSIEDAHWFINQGSQDAAIAKAIEIEGVFCGVIGVYLQPGAHAYSAEIGYWLAKSFWGKGIATHAVKQFVDELFTITELTRIYNPVTRENVASRRVMEKAGFVLEKTLYQAVEHNGQLHDEALYATVKSD